MAAVMVCVGSFPVQAAETSPSSEELNQKLEELQVETEIISDNVENLEEILSKGLNVSGYMDVEYIVDDREGKVDGFRIHHFSLFLQKKLHKNWSVFSELEFEDAPFFEAGGSKELSRSEGKILLEQVYADYHATPNMTLRGGRFLTPAGIWNINHYPPFVTTQSRPLHIRNIFPQYLDGLELSGSVNIHDYMLSYSGYAANGGGNPGSGDQNEDKAFGGRLEFNAPLMVELKIGVSALNDKLNDGTEKTATGADLQLNISALKIQAEYATADMKPGEGQTYGMQGYYVQALTNLGMWTFFGRYDYFNENDTIADNGVFVSTGGLNYHWTPTVVSKIEANYFDYQNEEVSVDHTVWILSLSVFF